MLCMFFALLTTLGFAVLAVAAPLHAVQSPTNLESSQRQGLPKNVDSSLSGGLLTPNGRHGAASESPATLTSVAVNSTSLNEPAPIASSSTGVNSPDVQVYLKAHNDARGQHNAVPLTWSDDLAVAAQAWASGCKFGHSDGSLGPFGENLVAGTGTFPIQSAMALWVNEAAQYNSSNPVSSHFTQIVWKATTQLGCAVAQCDGIFNASFGKASYYVCEYSSVGNVIGEFAENVEA